jgi:hypothetical protein
MDDLTPVDALFPFNNSRIRDSDFIPAEGGCCICPLNSDARLHNDVYRAEECQPLGDVTTSATWVSKPGQYMKTCEDACMWANSSQESRREISAVRAEERHVLADIRHSMTQNERKHNREVHQMIDPPLHDLCECSIDMHGGVVTRDFQQMGQPGPLRLSTFDMLADQNEKFGTGTTLFGLPEGSTATCPQMCDYWEKGAVENMGSSLQPIMTSLAGGVDAIATTIY